MIPPLAQAFGCSSGELVLCKLREPSRVKPEYTQLATCVPAAASAITCCTFSPAGELLVLGCEDGTLVVWDPATCTKLTSWRVNKARVSACSFSADGRLLAAGDVSGLLLVWDVKEEQLVQLTRWVEGRVGVDGLCACLHYPILSKTASLPSGLSNPARRPCRCCAQAAHRRHHVTWLCRRQGGVGRPGPERDGHPGPQPALEMLH
jgi:WD40 repeat protein